MHRFYYHYIGSYAPWTYQLCFIHDFLSSFYRTFERPTNFSLPCGFEGVVDLVYLGFCLVLALKKYLCASGSSSMVKLTSASSSSISPDIFAESPDESFCLFPGSTSPLTSMFSRPKLKRKNSVF